MNFGQAIETVNEYAAAVYQGNKMTADKQQSLKQEVVEDFINEGYFEFGRVSRVYRKPPIYVTTIAGTAEYDIPTGMFGVELVVYLSGTSRWKMNKVRTQQTLWASQLTGVSPVCYDMNFATMKMTLYPAPTYSGELIGVSGIFIPDAMTLPADVPKIPTHYHQCLVNYANFKVQELVTVLTGAEKTDKKSADFLSYFRGLAEECRKEIEYTDDDDFALLTEEETLQLENRFSHPTFNNSPVITALYFKNLVQFIDVVTKTVLFEVSLTDIKWKGVSLLGFPGLKGTGTYGSTTGTVITIGSTMTDTTYRIRITTNSLDPGDIGNTYYLEAEKTLTTFKIYNCGSNTTATFEWEITF